MPVSELAEPFIHLDRPTFGDDLGGFQGPEHWTRDDAVDSDARQPPSQGLRLFTTSSREPEVELPAEHDLARSGLTMPGKDEVEHRPARA
jgi:hypothetical protein